MECSEKNVKLSMENSQPVANAPRELLCDDICETEARNRKLAEAFGVPIL